MGRLCSDLFPSSTGNSVFVGAGVGDRLSSMFRADITIDYLTPVKVTGHSTAAASSIASADLDSIVGLANGYFDFEGAFPNMFGRLQPYVSAGIGVARNHLGTTTGVSPLIGPFTLGGASRKRTVCLSNIGHSARSRKEKGSAETRHRY